MLTINTDQKPVINLDAGGISQIDLEAIIEQICKDLGGTVSRSVIRQVVIDVYPRYEDARILTYVPIFLGREVRRRLLASD